MKTPVAITLIITGAILILAPIASDQLHEARLSQLMSRPGITSVRLENQLGELFRFGCWLTGSAMIALAVRFAAGSRRLEAQPCAATQGAHAGRLAAVP